MPAGRITLLEYLRQQSAQHQSLHPDLGKLVLEIAKAVQEIAVLTSQGALAGVLGSLESQNVQGETQKKIGCSLR